jgi:DNA-binding XRE family transcriptional regulator
LHFVNAQTWASANALATAAHPIIDYYISLVAKVLPTEADAASELLNAQLGRVVLGGWLAAATSTEVGLAMGLAAELRGWLIDLKTSGAASSTFDIREIHPPQARHAKRIDPRAARYLVSAGVGQYIARKREDEYLLKLNTVRTRLGITSAELARLLGVSREAIRQWDLGATISEERWPAIDTLFRTAEHLARYYKLESLPAILRTKNPRLSNQSPLEWLFAQKHAELVNFYDRLFSYVLT